MIFLPRLFCLVISYLFLVACTTSPAITDYDPASHAAALKSLSHWQVQGRAAIHGQNRSDNIGIVRTQNDLSSELVLSGPIGWGRYQLRTDTGFSELELGDGFEDMEPAQQQQIKQRIYALPLQELALWLKGMCELCENLQHDTQGRLLQFNQGSWQVNYLEYQQVGTQQLPRKLSFSGNDSHGKLVLKKWQIED